MLKTNKIVSLILAVVLVVSMFTVALTSTSALSEGETWVVAGEAGLCGAEWQMPPSDSNYMSYNPENGNYEITYTGIAAGTYAFKVVNGTVWGDPDYNLEGQANSSGNASVTVTEDGSTVLVGCDGTKAYVTVTAGGDTPTPQPSSDDTPVEPGETMTVYFQNNWMWTEVCAYWWIGGAEWPGEPAQLVGNDGTYDIYAVTVPTTAEGIIFNGNDAGTGAENKTPDIKDAADGNCYYMVWNETEAKNEVGVEDIDVILPPTSEDESSEDASSEDASSEDASSDDASSEDASSEDASSDDASTDPEGLFVRADGVLYPVVKGEKYTYEFFLTPDQKVCSFDATVKYDAEGVKPVLPIDEYGDLEADKVFPVFGSATVYNNDIAGEFFFNYSSAEGIRFKSEKRVLSLDFEVTADEGIYDIYTIFTALAVNTENDEMITYRNAGEETAEGAGKYTTEYVFNADPYVPGSSDDASSEDTSSEDTSSEDTSSEDTSSEDTSSEDTSSEDTSSEDTSSEDTSSEDTSSEDTSSDDPAGLFVRADGVLYPVVKGEKYTYEFFLTPDQKVCSFDASVVYDEEGLTPVLPVDEYGDLEASKVFPVFGSATVYNNDIAGEFFFNYSSAEGIRFKSEKRVLSLDFEVTADEGIYEIYSQLKALAVNTENDEMIVYVNNYEAKPEGDGKYTTEYVFNADPYVPDSSEDNSSEDNSSEDNSSEDNSSEDNSSEDNSSEDNSSEDNSSEDNSSENPEPDFYVAAGDDTLFGSAWNPADRNNELLPNGDGTYSKVYENVAAGTYNFKVTTNGAWDIGDYNLEGDARFGGPNAVAEVLHDGATVVIGFDGTKATLSITYPDQPSSDDASSDDASSDDASSDDASSDDTTGKLQIRVDGEQVFDVKKGEVYTYTFYLACDKKICSLDCITYYSADGLKVIPAVDEYGDATGAEFPNLTAVYNFGVDGQVIYNYSSVSGTRFPVADTLTEKNIVFQGKFEVTADEGIYDIYTDLRVLGDDKNNKIVFGSEQVDPDATVLVGGTLEGNFVEPDSSDDQPSSDDVPSEDESSEIPGPATTDESSTDDEKGTGNKDTVKTGATSAAFALLTVLAMAAGLVMFSRKRSNG